MTSTRETLKKSLYIFFVVVAKQLIPEVWRQFAVIQELVTGLPPNVLRNRISAMGDYFAFP